MALPDVFKLNAATARTSGFSSTAIANAASANGSTIDNATNLDELLTAEVVYSYGTNPTASKTIKIYLCYAPDGTNFESHDASNLISTFSPAANTSTHRRTLIKGYPLLPFAFRLVVENVDTGQTITVTINAYTHNSQVVD